MGKKTALAEIEELEEKLTEKEKLFVEGYLKHFNGARAAREADFGVKCEYTLAHQLTRKHHIKKIIEYRFQERREALKADAFYVVQRLIDVVEADIAEWIMRGKGGVPYEDFQKMPKDLRKLIQSADRIVKYDKQTKEKTVTVKFKLMDKTKCLELLGKHLGMFGPDSVTNVNILNVSDWAKTQAKKVNGQ